MPASTSKGRRPFSSRPSPQIDLDFESLDGRAFEALCFDLLRRLGYRSVVWRDGSGDRGRDIEARFQPSNPLSMGDYWERWFFECKNQKAGVGVSDLSDKVAWADAEKPDHLAFLISSHLTQDARDYVEKIAAHKRFRIHILEGHALVDSVQQFPDLVERHFRYSLREFLGGALRQWNALCLLPSTEQIALLADLLDGSQTAPETNALVWVTSLFRESELEELDDEELSFSPFLRELRPMARPGDPLLHRLPDIRIIELIQAGHAFPLEMVDGKLMVPAKRTPRPNWNPLVAAHVWVADDHRPHPALYAYVVEDDGASALEILVEGGATLTSSTRLVESDIEADQRIAIAPLR